MLDHPGPEAFVHLYSLIDRNFLSRVDGPVPMHPLASYASMTLIASSNAALPSSANIRSVSTTMEFLVEDERDAALKVICHPWMSSDIKGSGNDELSG